MAKVTAGCEAMNFRKNRAQFAQSNSAAEEQQRFLAQLPEHLSELTLFGLHTGCRQGEIVGVRWE